MALSAGARLGPYEIVAAAGSGGMGEVYRARDTRLGREVAIKVLPQHLSADAGRRERFEREARAVSSLNHPNICVLHDIGHQGGVDYLVLELLEGETVAERLLRGAMPPDQVMRSATEIASALARAHRQGIVHRDLKPQNVMLTKTGAKLLDFGLAKLREGEPEAAAAPGPGSPAGASPAGSILPTATRNLTGVGALLGTFQYMAPEQLEGREADARTDLFAFGALLYEMASGRRAFEGGSQASLIAAIMGKEPVPLAQAAPLAPAALDRIVRRCLAKDPDDRWQSASDLAHALREAAGAAAIPVPASSAPSGIAAAEPVKKRRGIGIVTAAGIAVVAALATALATALVMFVTRPPAITPAPLRANLILPAGLRLIPQDGGLALSPDGRLLALVGGRGEGDRGGMLYVRRLDSLEVQPLTGTEGATYPFWSPDGRMIGFFAGHKLRKIPAAGGTVVTLCEAQDARGGSWNRRGDIVFAPAPFGGLMRVDEAGGTPTQLTTPESNPITHRLPWFLPDGRRLLLFVGTNAKSEGNGIAVLDLDSKTITPLLTVDSGGRYVAPGWLVFVRDRNLMAQRFDPVTLRLSGEAAPIAERVRFNPNRWTGAYTLSDTGLLLSQSGSLAQRGQLTWFDLEGKPLGTIGTPSDAASVEVAPDGKRAALVQFGSNAVPQIWLYDLVRGLGSRFTFDAIGAGFPVFSPDSRQVAYTDSRGRILVKDVEGSAEARLIADVQDSIRQPTSWTPDGRFVLSREQVPGGGWDVVRVAATPGGERLALVNGPADEDFGRVSPDGRWLAYESSESGETDQLFIVPFDDPKGRKYQVTSDGVRGFYWLTDRSGIIYRTPDRRMRRIDVTPSGDGLVIGAARPLFGDKPAPGDWALHPDGRRILALVPEGADVEEPLALITDWAAGLQAR